MKRVIRLLVTKARIPGVRDGDSDDLIRSRPVGRVQAEKARSARRAGGRTLSQKSEDANYRSYGMPVFDRRAGQSELAGYLGRARRGE